MFSRFSLLLGLMCLTAVASQCTGQGKLSVTISYDGNPEQNSAELTDVAAGTTSTLTIAQLANTPVSAETCVDTGKLYKIAILDSGGDGFAQGAYASISLNDRLIATISDFTDSVEYFFTLGTESCASSETRFVLNLKFDGSPLQTSWSLGSGSSTVASGSGTAALANGFFYFDQCISAGSYTFSISDTAGGIADPGFYRIFNEYTLLKVGGGSAGFRGTESTDFTVVDSTSPTPAPTLDGCDDSFQMKFPSIDDAAIEHNCIWLADSSRNATEVPRYCVQGNLAYDYCPETCGRCSDDCFDTENVFFDVNGISRDCEWVRVRLAANFDFWNPQLCVAGQGAYDTCKESCENCGSTSGSGSTPSPVSPTPGPGPMGPTGMGSTPAPVSATAGPTSDPKLTDPCDDSITDTIMVDGVAQTCRWLESNPTMQATVCAIGHVSGAYSICEETCGKCSDNCEDTTGTITDNAGIVRACAWIADDPVSRRPVYCFSGSDAWTVCPETCGNCVAV